MAVSRWLVHKSAFVRLGRSPDHLEWAARIDRGLLQVSTVTMLELGFSTRSGASWRQGLREPPLASLPLIHLTPRMEMRAVEVQGLLAERGHHRAVKIPDLLLAAVAELAGLVVLHVDKDFDLVAEITGQPVERLTGEF